MFKARYLITVAMMAIIGASIGYTLSFNSFNEETTYSQNFDVGIITFPTDQVDERLSDKILELEVQLIVNDAIERTYLHFKDEKVNVYSVFNSADLNIFSTVTSSREDLTQSVTKYFRSLLLTEVDTRNETNFVSSFVADQRDSMVYEISEHQPKLKVVEYTVLGAVQMIVITVGLILLFRRRVF